MLLKDTIIRLLLIWGKKLPFKLKNLAWICIASLKLKAVIWSLKGNGVELYRQLGFKNCKKLYKMSSRYHKRILKETDHTIRATHYTELYEEIYNFVNLHIPGAKEFGFSPDLINEFMHLFRNKIVIDYGCGKGSSTRLISKYAKFVYGIDASDFAVKFAQSKSRSLQNIEYKQNFDIFFVPFENETIDTVYSKDLLEHLHPADAILHLKEIYRILKHNGKYLFWTPGSKSGPHDITQCFYPRSMGFKPKADHLKEYTFAELIGIIQEIGFKKIELPDLTREVLMIAIKD